MPLCRSPLTLRLRYSRVRGRRQSKFLASSSTGGARNFYPKGGINAPPETERFLISTASPTGSRAVFQYASDARPPKVLRTSRGYYFNNSAKGAHSARRLSRDWRGEGARQNRSAIQGSQGGCRRKATELPKCNPWLSPPLAGCPHPSRCSAARSTAPTAAQPP